MALIMQAPQNSTIIAAQGTQPLPAPQQMLQQPQAFSPQVAAVAATHAMAAPQAAESLVPPAAAAASVAPPLALQQGTAFTHHGLNGGWQNDRDYQDRRKMITKIVLLLQQRKPNAPQEWLKKLPQMAKRLEESLYRSAKSFEEYNNANTLKQRLQQLAVSIGIKTQKIQQAQILQHQQKLRQISQQQAQQQQQQLQQQQQQQLAQPVAVPQPVVAAPAPVAQPLAQPQQLPLPQIAQLPTQRVVDMSEINPLMAAAPAPAPVQQVQYVAPPVLAPVAAAAAPGTTVPMSAASVAAPAAAAPGTNGITQQSDRQQVLRHQQQRLLLLRHAAKCQHEDGRCPVTPHCAGMKRLWKHIAECKNQKCLVPHCVSSRYVLSHYHRCKDVRCPVCGPVREAIHRSHEKQKHMQALKERHQQAVQQKNSAALQPPVVEAPAAAAAAAEPPTKRRKSASFMPAAPTSLPSQPKVSGPVVSSSMPPVATVPGIAFQNGQVVMPKYSGPKPQEDHTLINCFSVEEIEKHIASLNNGLVLSPQTLKLKASEVLRVLQSHQHAWVFNAPVDPVELGLPDYFQVIKNPMDLGTVKKKLENGVYHKLEEFEEHVILTFDNAMLYNPEGSVVYNMANEMKVKFKADFEKLMKQLKAEEDKKRRNGEACSLCGCEKLLFEPPVFYCNGFNCPAKRIRRNSFYYVAGNNQYHWCHLCFQELRDGLTLDLGDMTVKKESLTKKKHDEVHEESWVQCDRCERWIHQICALFNTRQNKDQRSEFACPRCTLEERRKSNKLEATSTTPMAEDLPRTKLSEYLESHVRTKVNAFLEIQAKSLCEKQGMTIEAARKQVEMGGHITIRQVTSMDRKLEVRERMKKRYKFKNYPEEFSFRCKCIVVFQNLDGVDVVLFGLYVYEHDESNPKPNTRTVYVSYLDSVHYMRPRSMRTVIYHEILVSYLDYVRRRGFATAHIWACPPLKGDDYILYAKPEDQKTPKDDRLRQWYFDMLEECQRRGIVGKVTNMFDVYFNDPNCDATDVPYMDGDYFPAEVENIIKDIEDGKAGKGKKSSSKGKNKDKKAKEKKKTGRGGTRSSGLDGEALVASGLLPPGADAKSLQDGARDFVMVKLAETIQPMKDSFIVAYLAWEEAKEEHMVVPKAIQDYRNQHGITWRLDAKHDNKADVVPSSQDVCVPATKSDDDMVVEVTDNTAKPESTQADSLGNTTEVQQKSPENGGVLPTAERQSESQDSLAPAAETKESAGDCNGVDKHAGTTDSIKQTTEAVALPKADIPKSDDGVCSPETKATPVPSNVESFQPPVETSSAAHNPAAPTTNEGVDAKSAPDQAILAVREGKFAAMAKKRDLTGEPKQESTGDTKEATTKETKKPKSEAVFVKNSRGQMVKVLDDDEEELDSEILNNRQLFLNLCQGNHYQFDHLRRAKHSSMMVLWHLHNRDAPKFVQQCGTCSREILTGYRFNCSICSEFDQCQECYQNVNIQRHPHPLKAIPIASGNQNELTEAQRKERQRSVQLHMTLLLHAATCNTTKCPSANCTKMKGLLKHGSTCTIKATGGCNVCKRIWALLQIHARQCKADKCPVPSCMAIRERVRQLKKQQQAMDDRRRQEMNRVYRGKR